ncbi:recombinase, partial [Bacteroides xylanisolvens]
MGKTISFAKGKGNIRHNNRDFFTDNIDRDRTPNNITYVKQDLEAAYDEIFGQALQDYNAKQKRSDRKIESYLEHIRKSKNGEQLFHEVIVQLGDK